MPATTPAPEASLEAAAFARQSALEDAMPLRHRIARMMAGDARRNGDDDGMDWDAWAKNEDGEF